MLSKCSAEEDSRVPWTARRSNQSILKEINPEYSLEGLMLKLKLQHFGHLMQRANSLEKTLILGKTEGRRRRRWQRMKWLNGLTDSMDMSLSKLWVMVKDREPGVLQSMESQRVGLKDLATEQQFLINSCFNWLFQWTYLQQRLVEVVKKASSSLSFQEN